MPFDPTPTVAPAESQSSGLLATSAARADAGEIGGGGRGAPALSEVAGELGAGRGSRRRLQPAAVGAARCWLLVLGAGCAALFVGVRMRKRRGLGPAELAEAQVAELRRALVRLGWDVPVDHHPARAGAPAAASRGPRAGDYAGALRAHRYEARPAAPAVGDRRALRRELSAVGGLRGRLRGLLGAAARRAAALAPAPAQFIRF